MKNHLWSDLFSFVSIVDAGSFTKAAVELGLSPSVLSKRIRRLEGELKVSLLKRDTRKIFLTEAGKQCYDEVSRLRGEFEQVIETAAGSQHNPKGKLRISAPFSFGQLHLTSALFEFIEHYPDIQIELLLGQPSTRLIEKNIDIGIFIKQVPDSRLIAKQIGQRKITVCASPEYFKHNGLPQSPEELVHHNCLLYHGEKLSNNWRFQKSGKAFCVEVDGNFSANSSQVLAQAAIEGKGIVKLPGYMVNQAVKEGKLVSILENYCPREMGIYAAYPFTRHPSAKVKILIDFLAQKFKDKNHWNG